MATYSSGGMVAKKLTDEQDERAQANAAARGKRLGAYDNLRAAGKPMAAAHVGKGVLRQSVAPVTARVNPNRSLRRIITGDAENARRVIGKAANPKYHKMVPDLWKKGHTKTPPMGDMEFRYRATGSSGRGALSRKLGITEPPPGQLVGKAMPNFKPLGQALTQPKALLGGLRSGYQAGRTGATSLASPAGAGGRVGMGVGRAAGANPVKTGAALGAATAGGLTATRPRQQQSFAPQPAYGGFGKRAYDPEGERRFRLGAGASATAIGGLGALGYAAREGRDATKIARRGAAFGPHAGNLQVIELENGTGNKVKAKLVSQRAVHTADRLKRGGLAITRRGAGAGVAGLGLLGTSGALLRNRNEERWN